MITARAIFESESGGIKIRKVVAAPETLLESVSMTFRSGYMIAPEHESDTVYPVFERQVSATYTEQFNEEFRNKSIRSFSVYPTKLNGYEYHEGN